MVKWDLFEQILVFYLHFRPANYKELFNLWHASLQNVIEHIFGVCKCHFRLMAGAAEYSLQTQSKIPALHPFIILSMFMILMILQMKMAITMIQMMKAHLIAARYQLFQRTLEGISRKQKRIVQVQNRMKLHRRCGLTTCRSYKVEIWHNYCMIMGTD